jgi:hypothetical protein
MKNTFTTQHNSNPMKIIFSSFCGWIAGLVSLANPHLLHIGNFSGFPGWATDLLIFLISCFKAIVVGGFSWLGATAVAFTKKKFDIWAKNKKNSTK